MPEKKIPDETVARLVEAGKSNTEIVEHLRQTRGTIITRQAISMWRRRHGYEVNAKLEDEWAPWPVEPRHQHLEPYRIIRAAERERRGWKLNDEEKIRLARARKFLASQPGDMVFDYRPEHPQGPWVLVPRRQGVDTWIVRNPRR